MKHHANLIQGSEEWLAARCGLLTASEMDRIITYDRIMADEEHANNPKKKVEVRKKPKNEIEKEKTHLYELLAQRITSYVEPTYIGDDMLHGLDDELDAKRYYEDNYERVTDMGFITNDKWGFTLGFSPDGLLGEEGILECKGRRQKFQAQTILDGRMPDDYMIQVQTGLLVSERKWCDFISFCGGMHMVTIRVEADEKIQTAILTAAKTFHDKMDIALKEYNERVTGNVMRLIPTERRIEQEITL